MVSQSLKHMQPPASLYLQLRIKFKPEENLNDLKRSLLLSSCGLVGHRLDSSGSG
jgi:hypothetical protein